MGIYKFDTSTHPITRSEWDDGVWDTEQLSRNEVLTANDDGTFTLVKTYADLVKTVVYAPTTDATDDPSWYSKSSESYTLPNGTVVAAPGEEEDNDGIEDDQDGDGSNDDNLNGTDGNDLEHGGNGDDLLDGGAGNDDLSGDQGDDHLNGGAGVDKLKGGVGFDVLAGGDGNDSLNGEADDDVLEGGTGNDNLSGGTGSDDLDGGTDNDRLDGGAGDDSLEGGDGNDNLAGGDGADALHGGAGNDVENGGGGDDDFQAGDDGGNDQFVGGAGADRVDYGLALAAVSIDLARGQAKAVSADAGVGIDRLSAIEDATGSDHDDQLTGSTGANALDGGAGNDVLTGGAGKDLLRGGDGADVFRFVSLRDSGLGTLHDVIADFASGDHIDLSLIDAKAGFTRNDAFTWLGGNSPTLANANGALWFKDGVLYASTDADVAPEFEVALTGVTSLGADDVVL